MLDKTIGLAAEPEEIVLGAMKQQLGQRSKQRQIESLRNAQKHGCMAASWHIRKHVIELYESFVVRKDLSRERTAEASQTNFVRQPEANTFVEVLKLYYPTFSRPTLESMIVEAKDGMDLVDRRKWVAGAKGTYSERLRLAFVKSDKDGSGGLSLPEFVAAVKETGAQAPTSSGGMKHSSTEDELTALFAAADLDGDGVLDFDEFLELCSAQPWLVAAFDRIVELGVRRKLRSEETRLGLIFRHPVSPTSRLVKTPGGHRWRPSLHDLRPPSEVGDLQRRMRLK